MTSRFRTPALVFAFWTAFGLVETVKSYVATSLRGIDRSWVDALVGNMPWWYGWAALTPAIVWLAARARLDADERRGRALAVHAAFALVCAAVHIVVIGTLFYYASGPITASPMSPVAIALGAHLRRWFDTWLMLELVTYAGIVGAYYALDFSRRYRESVLLTARLGTQAAELRTSAAEARLHALRMEINPHFLFNALNAISGLVRRRQNDDAVRMLAGLGDLLRTTIDREASQETPLRDELELLERYLAIERVRFADRLTVEIDVDPAVRGALVPGLLLQPLVENAIRHGIARRPGPGLVRIRAARDGARLLVEVQDTGDGPPAARTAASGVGIGLSNTRARLEQLYGPDAGFELATIPGGGARATVWLPYHERTENAPRVAARA